MLFSILLMQFVYGELENHFCCQKEFGKKNTNRNISRELEPATSKKLSKPRRSDSSRIVELSERELELQSLPVLT